MKNPTIILCVGHPSTGKSTSTQRIQFELARTRNVDLLTTMSIRKELGLFKDLWAEKGRDLVYEEITRHTEERLARGADLIVLDGNFNKRRRREAIYAVARRHRADVVVLECYVNDLNEIKERMDYRQKNQEAIANRASSLDLYHLIKEETESLEEDLLPGGQKPLILHFNTDTQIVSLCNVAAKDGALPSVAEQIRACLSRESSHARESQVKAFLFDIGGVLQSLRWEAVSNRLADLKANLSMDEFRNALYYEKEKYFGRYEVAKMPPHEFWGMMAQRLDLPEGAIHGIREAFADLYGPVDSEMIDLVARLHGSYRLFILSNSCPELEGAICRDGSFYRQFEKIYFSHRIGFRKPDPEAFRFVLKENDLKANECLFVDDVSHNVNVAQEIGMQGLLFLSPARLKKTLDPYFS
ncbi:MAG: HAD-IA family hydrolase [Deltaproteobacteria bacterium]|nr:HAD-IA family hydrolase [Deltaproteobacteria bacterium]